MIEVHLKGLARRYRTQDTCIQRSGVCVLVSSNYKPVEMRTQCPWHLPLPYNRKEVTLLFVALIRNKSLSTWLRKATGENPAKSLLFLLATEAFLHYTLKTYDDILCAVFSTSFTITRGVENYSEMIDAGYHSNSNPAPHPVHILG